MPQFYAEILRGVGLRDNNFKPITNNDPATTGSSWFGDVGFAGTINSDGDLLTITGTDATHGVYKNFGQGLSTTTYPYLVILAKADAARSIDVQVRFVGPSTSTFTINLTTKFQRFIITLPSAKTLTQTVTVKFINQSSSGSNIFDYVYICKNTPLQLSQKDLINGTITRTSLGVDHAELRLNNLHGRFVTGSNAFGFGDHLHIYLGQGSTLYHVYGGYCEMQDPVQPNDEMILNSRGFGLALQETIAQKVYTTSTPQTILNDLIDSFVNAAGKDGVNIASNYQITRSFVQDLGSSIGIYITSFKNVFDVMREISDLTVAQGTPAVYFVDPAENLHFVPLGAQGAANWTTDPITATYATSLATGKNLITYTLRQDVSSLRNRVHYFAVAQAPAISDQWTENTASLWGKERLVGASTATFSDATDAIAIGTKSVKCILANAAASHAGGAMFYPATKDLGLNIEALGSINSPPIFDFNFRVNQGANPKVTLAGLAPKIFFATDATNRFEYNLVSDGGTPATASMLNIQLINNVTDNYWYRFLLSIGPHGGVLFNQTPVMNTVAPALYTGTSQFQLASVGTPDWKNINYVGLYWEDGGGAPATYSAPFWFDGWRILGGKYVLAYDNRAGAYPDMREIYFYDPVSKDISAIKNYALAELKRLWNPIVRGTLVTPLLADSTPEQQIQITTPSANYSNTYLRITGIIHRFSQNGFLTEFQVSNDFTNSQPLDLWKLTNAILQTGENAIISREVYDLKTATLDPSFTPEVIHP